MKKVGLIIFISLFFMMPNVYASSCKVTTSAYTVTVGSSVKITVKGSDLTGRVNVSSSNGSVLSGGGSAWIENSSSSFTFKANRQGTAKINVSPTSSGFSNSKGDDINVGCNQITITVKNKNTNTTKQTPSKSSNNDLKDYGIEGYTITPSFNKNVTSYTVTVPNGVNQIQINAFKDDDKATITGDDGFKTVSEGNNNFKTTIVAENGSKKDYYINVIVDSKPIVVKLNDEEYTMVKSIDSLPKPNLESEVIKLNIEDEEVDAYRIDSINYVLVGLKDSDGLVKLYKFDTYKNEEKADYTEFIELSNGNLNLLYLNMPKDLIPSDYEKEILEIDNSKIEAYKKDNFYIIYALNEKTNEKSLYKYDKDENTFQRYVKEEGISFSIVKIVFIIVASMLSILIGVIIALINRNKNINNLKEKKD